MDTTRFGACCAVTQGEGPFTEALRALGVPVPHFSLPVGGRVALSSLPSAFRYTWRLLWLARQARPDLIHVNAVKLNPYGVLLGRALGVPVICHVQAHVSPRAYFARLAFGAQTIVACSQAVAAPWQRMTSYNGRLRVVYYGIDPAPFSCSEERRRSERARLGLSENVFALGVVSRLSPSKKLEGFLRALQLARMKEGRLRALIAGDAPPRWRDYAATITQLPESMGLARHVVFLGYVRDIASLYAAFDAVVAPSDEEGLGRVPLEAMAAARPVIAMRAGGPTETVLHGETGILVPPQDPPALASAIVRLARDPALCQRLGEAGRRRAEEHFSLASYVRAFEGIYGQLLSTWSRGQDTLQPRSTPDAL